MTLATRKLGNDMVTELGFGAMGMSAFYGATPSDEERFEVCDTLLVDIQPDLIYHLFI